MARWKWYATPDVKTPPPPAEPAAAEVPSDVPKTTRKKPGG
jgi:hypothetical protein